MNVHLGQCSCCGQPLPPDIVRWDGERFAFTTPHGEARLTRRMGRVFDLLWQWRNRGPIYSVREIADKVYSADPSGGPDDAENSISVAIVAIRRAIEPVGWTITRSVGRPKVGFRLLPLTNGGAS